MVCPYCSYDTAVTNSRLQKRNNQIWRRRLCKKCGAVFTTYESIDLAATVMVMSHNTMLVPFSRDRLFVSILRACEAMDEAYEIAAELTSTVIYKCRSRFLSGHLSSRDIACTTADTLKRYNAEVFLRYASQHPYVIDPKALAR